MNAVHAIQWCQVLQGTKCERSQTWINCLNGNNASLLPFMLT